MKALLLPIAFLLIGLSPAATFDPDEKTAGLVFESWFKASIESFELTDASFEQGYDRLIREWGNQGTRTPFPFSLGDFVADRSVEGEPMRVTMTLRQIPFADALELLCKGTGRKMLPCSGFFRIQAAAPPGPGNWDARAYQISPALLKKLSTDPVDKIRMLAVYERRGVRFESWMAAYLVGERLFVLAGEEQHQQIAFINRLLEKGFSITPPQ